MGDAQAQCWVHRQETVSVLFLHEHHKRPQAYGGEDDPGNLIWLCTGCHDLLHRLATMSSSGRGGEVQDALSTYLPEYPAARERLGELVRLVVEAKLTHSAELATGEADDTLVEATVQFSRTVQAKLKALSQDWVHSSGRRGGLSAYLAAVLTHHALNGGVLPAQVDPDQPPPSRRGPQRL